MSFETPGWNIPPPSASVDSNPLPSALNASSNNNKRKRPSAAAGSEEKVASVGVNLEKLMAQMEREEKASKEGGPVGKKAKEREEAKKVKGEAMAKKFEGKPPLPPKGQQGGPAGGKAAGGKKEAGGKGGKGKQQQQPTTPPHNGVPPAVVESVKEVTTSAEEPPMKKTKLTKAEKKRALKAAVDAAGGVDAASLPVPPPAIALPTTVPTPNKTHPAAPSPKSTQVVAPVEEKGKKAGKKEKKKQAAAQAQAQEAKKGGGDVAMSEAGEGEVRNAVEVPMEEDLPVSREPGLTTMQAKMKGRLEGARFRWINEQLYTTSSDAALEMMKADPTVFADYHQGFRHQASSWPSSPVTLLTSRITSLLPTTASSPLIIDLGAGDAQLAKDLTPLGYNVLSYDLIGDYDGEGWVAEADYCQRIPLPGASSGTAGGRCVDGAVCCLSLMGRNWIGGVREIARVLKDGGVYEIAEITSRMPSVDAFIEMVSSLGFKLTRKDDSNTHFLLFSFVRQGKPTWDQGGSVEWEEVLKKGEEVLKACVYKKR